MNNKKIFCNECKHNVLSNVESTTLCGNFKGEEIQYEGKTLSCTDCNHDIKDFEISEQNVKSLNNTYRNHHNIISVGKIKKLPEMYAIGKRPLSIILGWGELTFSRYYDGDMPSPSYSLVLDEIYNSPASYLKMLENNKDLISSKSYQKSMLSAKNLLIHKSKTIDILSYIFLNCPDTTISSAHKLLYYIQGFHIAFFDENIINEPCFLDTFGPYFKDIHISYNDFGNLSEINLTPTQKIISDNVIKYFACYSGMILTKFTLNELPSINVSSLNNNLISVDDMTTYFKSITNKYNMISPIDIHIYAKNMFDLI